MVALKTFTNLSVDRQAQIIAACLEEFALHEYQTASLSRIVSKLNLAKGSFYRYFENKQSLYFFLLDHCIKTRLKNDKDHMTVQPADFFELMIEHLKGKMKFDNNFPLHSAFLNNVMQEKNNEELGNIQLIVKLKALESVKPLVEEAIKANVFRNDVDVETIAFLVYRIQFTIIEYLELKHKIDFRQNIKIKKPFYNLSEQDVINTARPFIEIFKTGIIQQEIEQNNG